MASEKEVIGTISAKSDHEVEWTIDNFFSYTAEDERYFSPYFAISGSEWRFRCLPNGLKSDDSVGWISLYLETRVEDNSPPVGATYTFGVKKMDGTVGQLGREFTWAFAEGDESHGHPRSLERSVLLRRRSELTSLDSLTFTCTLRTDKCFESPGNLDALSRDLADLFISKKGSDATLVVQRKVFPVHKSILSARSSVLAAMFEADMKEKRTGLVEIEDCDPEAFSVFLTYLYSGKVEKGSSKTLEIYRIADKYDVQDLKSYCCIAIMVNLSVENVLDAVLLGRQFDENSINLKTQNFFNQNYTKIIPTTEWTKFLGKNTTVANQLLKGMVKEKETKK